MAQRISLLWIPRFEGASRAERKGCSYESYVPDPLAGWDLNLPADLAADIADAEGAARALNAAGTSHVSLEGLARFLLRAESVASSKIEGIEASPQRLMRAEALLARGGDAADRAAAEILANIGAMQDAVERASAVSRFELGDLLAVHRRLMAAAPATSEPGLVRTVQNWIGGSSHNPCGASFVPPPPEHVAALLDDLITYLNGEEHSPLVQAAVVHAQFETIHPFVDGNGRTGRALIHVVLRRRGLTPRFVPPISLILATWSAAYVGALTAFRHDGAPDGPERSRACHGWLCTFASATLRACRDAERYATEIESVEAEWRHRLGRARADSAVDRLLRVLPGAPVLTVQSAAGMTARSEVAAAAAITRLVAAGILAQRNLGRRRYRVFEAGDVVRLFTSLERSLASPSGDTVTAPPVRPAPHRPG
jgi:Fic family protein